MLKVKSITTNILLVTFIAIILVGAAVIIMAISQHESLYREQVEKDTSALSANLSEDLVQIMASGSDYFLISNLLLRLSKYDDVLYAKVLSNTWQETQTFYGKKLAIQKVQVNELSGEMLKNLNVGTHFIGEKMVTINLIGDKGLPLGYLVVVTDYFGPITESKQELVYKILPPASVLIFFSLAFILFRQHALLTPISVISNFSMKVKHTKDYSLRLSKLGKYEVKQLSLNINSMMATIESEIKKNKQSREKLIYQQKKMEQMANFDSLTGLPNRNFFMEILKVNLAKAKREHHQVVIMFIDLDGFKDVNDNYGHHIGDQLLVEVSHRMKECLRDSDVLCRLGGDEFLVLLPHYIEHLTIIHIANRIIEYLQEPFFLAEWEVHVGASIGITTAEDSNFDVSNIIGNADIAMYQSKVDGKGTFTIFAPQMMESSKRRFEVANAINLSITREEFYLVFQGKVNDQQQIIGYEALLRWHHPELGNVSPGEFIPIAEQSGKMINITKWVLKQLCKEIAPLQALHSNDIVVSVNLSTNDLKQPELLGYIKELFADYDINPSNIEFEVTESAYLEDFETANRFFKEIKSMGSSLALDDFGTGYSSLSYLTQIPIDTLKLDKQFISKIGKSERSTLITKTIVNMAKNLNIKICAEGVENLEQYYFLINCHCDQIQGYLFSKPLALDKLKVQYSQDQQVI
jgi:diguanylate cyclase (GGDEF)-like protein